MSAAQEPEAINWKQWKEEGVDPQLVDTFQKAYDSARLASTCVQMDALVCNPIPNPRSCGDNWCMDVLGMILQKRGSVLL